MEENAVNEIIDNSLPVGRFHYRLLLICGLCFCADSMEVALLSFISICAGIEWNLSNNQVAFIASAVFVGTLVGNLIFGPIADRYGRRRTFLMACSIIIVAGVASAFSSNLIFLVLFRTLCGIGIGGVVIPFDLLAEFMPTRVRGQFLSLIGYFWTGGSVLISGLAWIILPRSNWHFLTLIAAIPVTISLLIGVFILPESPRWLVLMGRKEEALTVLREAAIYNGTPLDNTIMLSNEPTTNQSLQKSPFSILLHRNSVVLTMSVWLHWFFYGFCYYAVILFSMRVFAHQDDPQSEAALTQTHTCSFQYGELFVGSLSEALGVFFCTLVIERFGRLPALRWSYGLCSLFAFLLGGLMPIIPSSLISFLSYLARCSILCGVSSTWLATPEFFPTSTRVTAHAVASGVSRIGSFIAPFITQSSATTQEVALILGLACLTVVLTTAHLPETKGMALEECHGPRDGMKMKKPQRILSLLQRNRYQPLDETDSLRVSPAIATGNGSSPDAMCSDEEEEETEIVIRL